MKIRRSPKSVRRRSGPSDVGRAKRLVPWPSLKNRARSNRQGIWKAGNWNVPRGPLSKAARGRAARRDRSPAALPLFPNPRDPARHSREHPHRGVQRGKSRCPCGRAPGPRRPPGSSRYETRLPSMSRSRATGHQGDHSDHAPFTRWRKLVPSGFTSHSCAWAAPRPSGRSR